MESTETPSFTVLENKVKVLPHSCFICSKAFMRINTLLKHYREHTKELGENLERLEEVKAKYMSKKQPNQANNVLTSDVNGIINNNNHTVDSEIKFPTETPNLENSFLNDESVNPTIPTESEQNGDKSVIQNLDSNDIIITNMDSSNIMVQNLDPGCIVVEHLEPHSHLEPIASASYLIPMSGEAETYGCTVCGNCYTTASILKRHMGTHENPQTFCKYVCEICNSGFWRKITLSNHYRKMHAGEESFSCKLCKKKFFNKEELTTHKFEEHGIMKKNRICLVICEICGEDFFKKSALKMHYLSHPEERPFVCDICNESFKLEVDFMLHKQLHTSKNGLIVCKVCDESFRSKNELQIHKETMHSKKQRLSSKNDIKHKKKSNADRNSRVNTKQKIYVCNVCRNAFRDKQLFETHKKTHNQRAICGICDLNLLLDDYDDHMLLHKEGKTHTCRVCSESFMFKDDLVAHSRTAHVEDFPFECNVCKDKFKFKSDLRQHKQIHNNKTEKRRKSVDSIKPESSTSKRLGRKSKITCNVCGEVFTSKLEFLEHEEVHQMEVEIEEIFPCKYCSERFDSKKEQTKHITVCSKSKPYLCRNCNYRFSSKTELLEHKKTHSRRQPFICKICNEGFRTTEDLETHKKFHNTSPTYPCNICDKIFQQRERLKEHKLSHVGEIVYICSVCKETFEDKIEFKAHRETHDIITHQCKVCDEVFNERKELKKHYLKHILERPNMCRICNASFDQWAALRSHYLSHTRNSISA